MDNHFMIYLPDPSDEEEAEFVAELENNFGANNVYRIEGRGAFLVKTPESNYQRMLDKVGFTQEKSRVGLLVGVDDTNFNGRFYSTMWDFYHGGKTGGAHAAGA